MFASIQFGGAAAMSEQDRPFLWSLNSSPAGSRGAALLLLATVLALAACAPPEADFPDPARQVKQPPPVLEPTASFDDLRAGAPQDAEGLLSSAEELEARAEALRARAAALARPEPLPAKAPD